MGLVQCDQYEPFWAAHRDNWKPCTPADVWGLREDRTFQPPSKAHLKRLTRVRPVVVVARPRPVSDSPRQRELREAQKHGFEIRRMLMPNTTRPAEPMPYQRPAPVQQGTACAVDLELRRAQRLAEARRIASYGSAELGRAWKEYLKCISSGM